MTDLPTVIVLDDEASVRDGLTALLTACGHAVAAVADIPSALDRLAACPPRTVVLADVNLAGDRGLRLPEAMRERGLDRPIVYMSAYADLDMARTALRQQAIDLLEKPFTLDELTAALARAGDALAETLPDPELAAALAALTPREREVLDLIVEGCPSKLIARRLAISVRTVDVHRSRLLAKLGARNAPDLVRIGLTAGARRADP